MPPKYTLIQVQEKFTEKNCVLLSDKYINQKEKLEYIAACGHNNIIIFKDFLNNSGTKCRSCTLHIPNYEDIEKSFSEKGCKVLMTKEEFSQNYKNNNCKINYIASCGHENIVRYKNFLTLNQGTNCPNCVHINTGSKMKDFYANNEKLSSIKQELKGINYIKEVIGNHFTAIKLFDGCKADIAIQKFDEIEDLWFGIQVKTTFQKTENSQYYFRLNKGNYENCLILCICDEDKKMWLIPYEEVNGLKTIGIALKSKYNKFEVTIENIMEKLDNYYEKGTKFNFETIDTPSSSTQKQEQIYYKMRETKINFIKFIPNPMEGLVYDFKIGNKKVQEKVGSIVHNNPNSFCFSLVKYDCRNNKKCIYKCYEEGDNDFYWLHCKNELFYVIPEKVMIENGYAGIDCKRYKLYVSPTNDNTDWCNDYLFDYNNIDKERLLKLLAD